MQEPWLHTKLYDRMRAAENNWSSLSDKQKDDFCHCIIAEFHLDRRMTSTLSRLDNVLTRVSALPPSKGDPTPTRPSARRRPFPTTANNLNTPAATSVGLFSKPLPDA